MIVIQRSQGQMSQFGSSQHRRLQGYTACHLSFPRRQSVSRGGRLSLHEQFRPLSVGLQPIHKCKQFVSLLSFPMHLGLNSKPKQIYHGLNRIMDIWIRRWRIHVSMIRLRHDIFVLAWNWGPDRSETIKVIQIEFGCSVLLTYLCSFNVNLLPRCMAKYSTNCFLFLTRILH